MKCNDVQDILFAYIDGDVSDEEHRALSEHLAGCPDCSRALKTIRDNGTVLRELRTIPPLADYTESTIRQKAAKRSGNLFGRIPRPVAIAVPVILLLAVILPITLTGGASSVLAKAYTAIEKLESYRETAQSYTYFPDTDEKILSAADEAEFGGNDAFRVKYYPSGTGYYREVIVVDGNYYWFGRQIVRNTALITYFDETTPTREKTLDYLELIEDVQTLDDEVINGTECYHYKGTVSIDKWLEKTLPRTRALYERMQLDNIDEMLEYRKRYWQNREIVYELWVGKDDYLIRQITDTNGLAANPFYQTILVLNFSDLNEPVEIVPPLDENGELLEGWMVQPLAE